MKKSITYKTSGVDINKANVFVNAIKSDMAKTKDAAVIDRKGSFGALYALAGEKFKQPVLVSSTDGVGTKLLLAQQFGVHHTVGIDLVAMNVNDILCTGAKPLFFLDYIACGKLKPKVLQAVVKGIAQGCQQAGCSLIGGETAEMPGMYNAEEYDLAGFAVGVVEKSKIIDGRKIAVGDCVIGLPSSGIHSNGYSLVRKVFNENQQKRLKKELLMPTKIYVKEILPLLEKFLIKGAAHITGGAFYEKLTKVLPKNMCFVINKGSWPVPKIFQLIQSQGNITDSEMYRTFNMGIGFALIISNQDKSKILSYLKRKQIEYYEIGSVVKDSRKRIIFN